MNRPSGESPHGFHTGYRKTALQPGEIVARVRIPIPPQGTIQAFRKVGTREAQAISKVVLARDLVAHLAAPLDVRSPLGRLAVDYPGCWTFAVDGLIGHGLARTDEQDALFGLDRRHARVGPGIGDHPPARFRRDPSGRANSSLRRLNQRPGHSRRASTTRGSSTARPRPNG